MPDDMREIVTVEQVQRLFLLLAVLAPLAGAAIGAAIGARRGALAQSAKTGFLIGLLGPANLALWTIYNAITDRLGLDTVRNLFVNLVLFAAIGVGAGLVCARVIRPRAVGSAGQTPPNPPESNR